MVGVTIAPIDDRVGHVGGIESMTVDGRRWYFGFDYSSDMVVSPLIYLLAAAGGWESSLFDEPAMVDALTTIGIPERDRGWDCVERCVAALDAPDAAKSTAAHAFMTRYVEFVLDAAPANWPEVFAALRA
jgi:hypothetical protein